METRPKPRRRRWLRWLIGLVIVVLLVLYIGMPVFFGLAATQPVNVTVGAPPEGFAAVTLTVLDSVTAADSTDFLFIANGNDPDEVAFTDLYASAAGERAAVWTIPDAGHIQALARHPDEYAGRVVTFFEDSLLAE